MLIDKNENNFSWVEDWGGMKGGNRKEDAYVKWEKIVFKKKNKIAIVKKKQKIFGNIFINLEDKVFYHDTHFPLILGLDDYFIFVLKNISLINVRNYVYMIKSLTVYILFITCIKVRAFLFLELLYANIP